MHSAHTWVIPACLHISGKAMNVVTFPLLIHSHSHPHAQDSTLRLWQYQTGMLLHTISFDDVIDEPRENTAVPEKLIGRRIAVSPDSTLLAVLIDGCVFFSFDID